MTALPGPVEPPLMDTHSATPPSGRPADIVAIEASLAAEDATNFAADAGDSLIAQTPQQAGTNPSVPWWPFLLYLAVWIGSALAAGWQLAHAAGGGILYGSVQYAYTVIAGLLLTLFGPAVTFLVWLVSWLSAKRGQRSGLLSSALVRGGLVTFAGVALWWGMLVFVDATRLGRPW